MDTQMTLCVSHVTPRERTGTSPVLLNSRISSKLQCIGLTWHLYNMRLCSFKLIFEKLSFRGKKYIVYWKLHFENIFLGEKNVYWRIFFFFFFVNHNVMYIILNDVKPPSAFVLVNCILRIFIFEKNMHLRKVVYYNVYDLKWYYTT